MRISPVFCPTVPITCCEAIDMAPSEIAVQPAPRPPSARLKLSVASVAAAEALCGSASCGTSAKLRISNRLSGHKALRFP